MRSRTENSNFIHKLLFGAVLGAAALLTGCSPPPKPMAMGPIHFINGEVMDKKEFWDGPPKRSELSKEDIQPVQPRPKGNEAFLGTRP